MAYFTWADNTVVEAPSSIDGDATTSARVLAPGNAAKLAPEAVLGKCLAISYSGGSGMPDDVAAWLEENQIPTL